MNKETIKKFIEWLEKSGDDEIEAHRQYVLKMMKSVSSEGRADVRLSLRLIDEEVLAGIESRRLG
jgi:hypothetical protein